MKRGVALVTGAGGGIGRAIAKALLNAGFKVAANDLEDCESLCGTLEELRGLDGDATKVVGDVSDLSTHERLLNETEKAFGPVTTLVNNAGVSSLQRGDLLDVTPESYDRCQSVNARAVFFLSQAFARRVLARSLDPNLHHCIINITSSNARAVSVNRGEYCVSKAAASTTSRLFATRLGEANVAVYEIQPGVISTDMIAPGRDAYLKRIEAGLTLTPRIGQPEEIGSISRVLATGGLPYCTGQAIQADGGLTLSRF